MSQEAPPVRKNARGSITREQKRLQIINALGHAYSFILLIDIKKNTLEVVSLLMWQVRIIERKI